MDVSRATKVASLGLDAKQAARDAGLDDNRTALLKTASELTAAAQVRCLAERRRRFPESAHGDGAAPWFRRRPKTR
jgi:hypothetical protein